MSKHVCYINFDGFAKYYFDEFIKNEKMPNLKKLMSEGVFFENLNNCIPSITNPCQNMILSGSTSSVTKNVYRYYDKSQNLVVQQFRENANETIVDAALRNGLKVCSVAHYLTESRLTHNDSSKIYIYSDETSEKVLSRGEAHLNDHYSRFEQLIKVIKKEKIISKGIEIVIDELPNLLIFYADDIDYLGHNEIDARGYKRVWTEEERMNNVLTVLKEMDDKLGEFIEACKEADVYHKFTFFITTDHGMTPFGFKSLDDEGDYGQSMVPKLAEALNKFDSRLKLEMIKVNEKALVDTTVAGVGMNLNVQLTFLQDDIDLNKLKEHLLKEHYIYDVYTTEDLIKQGYCLYDTQMVIVAKDRYFFSRVTNTSYYVRGQHDSSLPSSKNVFGLIFGKGIKRNYIYSDIAYNYDFGTTMAYVLGIEIEGANGKILEVFEISNK